MLSEKPKAKADAEISSRKMPLIMLSVLFLAVLLIGICSINVVRIHEPGTTSVLFTTEKNSAQILLRAGISTDQNNIIETAGKKGLEINLLSITASPSSAEKLYSEIPVSNYGMLAQYSDGEQEAAAYKTVTRDFPIPFESWEQEAPNLPEGTKQLSQEGADGIRRVTYTQKIEDGKIIETVISGDEIAKPPVDSITLVGTYKAPPPVAPPSVNVPVISSSGLTSADVACVSRVTPPAPIPLDSNGHPLNYTKVLYGPATAYNGPTAWTSTGRPAMEGHVAVNPAIIPYGTKLYIVSADGKYNYGYSIAADTGGFIYYTPIVVDLFFTSYDTCINFGKRDVYVYILE